VEDEGSIHLDLAAYSPAVLTSANQLRATARVSNVGQLPLPGLSVTLSVTRDPLPTSSALQSFLTDPTTVATQVADVESVGNTDGTIGGVSRALAPGGMVPIDLSASPESLGMPAGTTGVYGVVIAVTGSAQEDAYVAAAITWFDEEIQPLRVAFVANASGSPERAAQVTSAASVTGAAIAIDASTVTDGLQARSLVTNREVFGLPTRDPDLTSIAHGEDRTLLDFAIADARGNSQASLQELPLLPTIPVVDAATVKLAADTGAIAGLLDIANPALPMGTEPVVDVTAGDVTLPVLVPNPKLSSTLASYRVGMPDAAARLVAESAFAALAGDGVTPVVVAPGSAWQLSGPGVSRPLAELLGAPWVIPVSAHSVIGGGARGSYVAPEIAGSSGDLAADFIDALSRQLADLKQLSLTAENPNTVYVPGGRTLLEPLAASLRSDPDARSATYQASRDALAVTLSGLHVASGSDVNLIAASGKVPVTLQNELDVDATVTVVMRSASPNLVIDDAPVVTIPAGDEITAFVAVTGISSANVSATVALKNADGDVVAAPQVIHVRVRADWGNAVTLVFSIGLALLLAAGIVRTIRRGRRSSRMAPIAPAHEASTQADDGDRDG